MSSEKLQVAIIGGGICGLACAIALLREGVDVQVYEAAVSEIMQYGPHLC
jgi:salicylate hydroxylase